MTSRSKHHATVVVFTIIARSARSFLKLLYIPRMNPCLSAVASHIHGIAVSACGPYTTRTDSEPRVPSLELHRTSVRSTISLVEGGRGSPTLHRMRLHTRRRQSPNRMTTAMTTGKRLATLTMSPLFAPPQSLPATPATRNLVRIRLSKILRMSNQQECEATSGA